jgi:hypothetical protein
MRLLHQKVEGDPSWQNPDSPNCNSDFYFKQISYYIDLAGKLISALYDVLNQS